MKESTIIKLLTHEVKQLVTIREIESNINKYNSLGSTDLYIGECDPGHYNILHNILIDLGYDIIDIESDELNDMYCELNHKFDSQDDPKIEEEVKAFFNNIIKIFKNV